MGIQGAIVDSPCVGVQRRGVLAHVLSEFRRWQAGCPRRARRVIVLLLALWVFNIFDLNFTLLACRIGGFEEANPIARGFMASEPAMIIYKLALILPATLIFLFFRRRLVTEIGCWMLFAAHVGLSGMWAAYYSHL